MFLSKYKTISISRLFALRLTGNTLYVIVHDDLTTTIESPFSKKKKIGHASVLPGERVSDKHD